MCILCFTAVKTHSPDKPVLVFVSSRRQTRLTALDLIAFLASEDNPKQWLHMEEMEVSQSGFFFLFPSIYSDTCLNQTMNKTESCVKQQ